MFRHSFIPALCILFVGPAVAQDMPLSQVLVDGEDWQLVSEGHKFTEGPATDAKGNVYFTDVPESKIFKINQAGEVSLFAKDTAHTNGLMFGADGRLYGCRNGDKQIVAYRSDGNFDVIASGVSSNDLVVASDGGIYFTDPPNKQVWHVGPNGKKRQVASGYAPNGIILWPREGTLVVTDSGGPHLWTYRTESDGELTHGDRYYQPLVTQPGRRSPGSDGMTVDNDGRLYLASYVGLQVFDTQGRPSGVIAKPQNKFLSNVVFGGAKFGTLYVTCTDKVYSRKTKVAGTPNFARAR